MDFLPSKEKMKCVCCRKMIPMSKVFMLFKEIETINGQEECSYKHMCGFCHMYVTTVKESITLDLSNRLVQMLHN